MATLTVNIPASEESFFRKLMKKMGWKVETKESVLREYLESRPKDCPLTDEDILSEIEDIRRKK